MFDLHSCVEAAHCRMDEPSDDCVQDKGEDLKERRVRESPESPRVKEESSGSQWPSTWTDLEPIETPNL